MLFCLSCDDPRRFREKRDKVHIKRAKAGHETTAQQDPSPCRKVITNAGKCVQYICS